MRFMVPKKLMIKVGCWALAVPVVLIIFSKIITNYSDCRNNIQKVLWITINIVLPITSLIIMIYLWNDLITKISHDFPVQQR